MIGSDEYTQANGIELSQLDSHLTHTGDEADEEAGIIKSTEAERLNIPKETLADRILRRKRAVPRIISIPHLQKTKSSKKTSDKNNGRSAYFDEDEYLDSIEIKQRFPKNIIRNQKYNVITFLPLTLYDQFKYFYNLYFLGTALTQFFPILKVGYLFTYVVPLAFVLALSIGKEGYDDIKRMLQDKRANSQIYDRLEPSGKVEPIKSSEIRVGDLVIVNMNNRIPADMVLLKTTDKSGASFIRTDQLDGETDWKLRRPLSHTQGLNQNELAAYHARIIAEAPSGDIYSFNGKFSPKDASNINTMDEEPISVENMLWANTVVATGQIIGVVVYTGCETRSALNRTQPRSKSSKTELEINRLSKILFAVLSVLSIFMVAMQGFSGLWYVYLVRFMILFSSIIPISMRVNLDMAKLLYALMINKDKQIPGTVVRNSTLPEELGRINILLSDKTGTLTQNDMVFKKLHYGTGSYRTDDMDMLITTISEALAKDNNNNNNNNDNDNSIGTQVVKAQKSSPGKALQCIRAIALCHNVTPSMDTESGEFQYQASSPDEVALVKFTEKVGVQLYQRDLHNITLRTGMDGSGKEEYEILRVFPFSSTTKRMGIIVRDSNGVITFFMKGADVVMLKIIANEGSEW